MMTVLLQCLQQPAQEKYKTCAEHCKKLKLHFIAKDSNQATFSTLALLTLKLLPNIFFQASNGTRHNT